MTKSPQSLVGKLIGTSADVDKNEIQARVAELPRPLVFTNGCFDILHRGHVTYLAQAAELGRSMVVAINDDASVRAQNKGPDRPVNCLADRMVLLAALQSVSAVVAFAEDTPIDLIRLIQPDVLVKGGDWAPDEIVGAEDVKARGGTVHSIPFEVERSTTSLLERIRNS